MVQVQYLTKNQRRNFIADDVRKKGFCGHFSHPEFVTCVAEGAALAARDPRCLTPSESPDDDMEDWERLA